MTSTTITASAPGARPFMSVAESSTRRHSAARSICRTRPESTLPGPTSTNKSTPSARSCVLIRPSAPETSLAASIPREARKRLSPLCAPTLFTSGTCGILYSGRIQIRAKAILRRLHQGAMERRADIQHDRAFGAARFGQIHGPRDGRSASPQSQLARANSSWQERQPRPGRLPGRFLPATAPSSPKIAAMAPWPTGTASCMYCPRLRTRRTASPDSKRPPRPGPNIHPGYGPATKSAGIPFPQDSCRGHRNGQNRGLGVGGKLKIFGRPFKAELGDGESQCRIGFLKNGAGGSKILRQLAAHAGVLRTLTGKDECEFQQDYCVRLVSSQLSVVSSHQNRHSSRQRTTDDGPLGQRILSLPPHQNCSPRHSRAKRGHQHQVAFFQPPALAHSSRQMGIDAEEVLPTRQILE